MLPNNQLSSIPQRAPFVEKVNRRTIPLVDYEMGGHAVGDASGGLQEQLWTVRSDGVGVYLSAENVAEFLLFSATDITQVSLAFDQNMQPAIAFVDSGVAKLRWFDSAVPGYVTTTFTGAVNPRVSVDEKRPQFLLNSDIVLAYTKTNNLYIRYQRDRFLTEYLLASAVDAELISIGMNTGGRFQFRLLPIS